METYTWDVTHMDMAKGWIASWEGGRWKVMEPLDAPGHKHKDNEQLPGRPGTDSCRERIQEQMWWWRQLGVSLCFPSACAGVLLPFHYIILFLPVVWIISTHYYYFLAPFSFAHVSAVHSMDFLCSISSSPFLPSFVPCLFLHKFILVAGHHIKYCTNRVFLWSIIKDRMWTADILAFSPGKKGGKALSLHVYFRWNLCWTEARCCSDPTYPPKPSFFTRLGQETFSKVTFPLWYFHQIKTCK